MTTVARHCAHCETILRRDNDTGYCAVHEPRERALRVVGVDEMSYAVAGVLLLWRALCRGHPCRLREELSKLGVHVDPVDLQHALRKLRRRGWEVHHTGDGYALLNDPLPLPRRRYSFEYLPRDHRGRPLPSCGVHARCQGDQLELALP